jgi:predicted ATP-grasp superfamily ATP-dependent carboligase
MRSSRKTRISLLLSEGSSTSARQTLYAIGGRYRIDIVDPAFFCQCRFSRYVRRIWRCPPFRTDPEGYLRFVVGLLRRYRYDVLFPTHEQVYLFSRFRDQLSELTGLTVPPFEALRRMISKQGFLEILDELKLPYPATVIARSRAEVLRACKEFPIFIKVDHTTAGEGVFRVEDQRQLDALLDRLDRRGFLDRKHTILVQVPADGIKGAVAGVFQEGQLVAYHCDQAVALGIGGSTLCRVTIEDPVAVEHLRRLGAHLGWHGPMALEVFRNPQTGTIQYVECNPRIGETVNPTLAGTNFCEAMVRISLGEKIPPLPPPRVGTRTHQGFLGMMAVGCRGGTRREVFRELIHWLTGKGHYAGGADEITRPRQDWLSLAPALAMTLQLLLWPRSAQWVVSRTVANYALSAETVEKILQMEFPE